MSFPTPESRWLRANRAIQRRDRLSRAAKAKRQPGPDPLPRSILVLGFVPGRHVTYEQGPRRDQQTHSQRTWTRRHKQQQHTAPETTRPVDPLEAIAKQIEKEQREAADRQAELENRSDDLPARFAGAPARKFFA